MQPLEGNEKRFFLRLALHILFHFCPQFVMIWIDDHHQHVLVLNLQKEYQVLSFVPLQVNCNNFCNVFQKGIYKRLFYPFVLQYRH